MYSSLGKRVSKKARDVGWETSCYIWRTVIGSVWLNHTRCARRLRWKQKLGSGTVPAEIIISPQTIFTILCLHAYLDMKG